MEGVKHCRFGGSRSVCARESYQRYGVASSSDFSMAKNPSHKNTMPENRTKNRKLAAKHCQTNVATEFTRNEPTALPRLGEMLGAYHFYHSHHPKLKIIAEPTKMLQVTSVADSGGDGRGWGSRTPCWLRTFCQ